jgi:hypothetical protein
MTKAFDDDITTTQPRELEEEEGVISMSDDPLRPDANVWGEGGGSRGWDEGNDALGSVTNSRSAPSAPLRLPPPPPLLRHNDPRLLQLPTPSANASNTTTNSTGGGGVGWTVVELRNGPLEAMWFGVYWITFILTYLFLPVVGEYVVAGVCGCACVGGGRSSGGVHPSTPLVSVPPPPPPQHSGEFTAYGRFKASIWANVIFYGIIGGLGAVALIFAVWYYGPVQLLMFLPLVISLANT